VSPQVPALLRRYPGLSERLPWRALGRWPTPVRRLERLGAALGLELWLKDDGASAPRYGGNKVRKLEPLLGAALAAGARTLLTAGGIGSNHALAVAVYARELGLGAGSVLCPQPLTPAVARTLARLARLGAALHPCSSRPLVPLQLELAARRSAAPVYRIGPGGSSPLGTLGYVSAGLELGEQIARGELPRPAAIVIALGSGGSATGLAVGLGLCGVQSEVVAVRVVERWLANAALCRILVARTRRLLARLGVTAPRPAPLSILGGELGRGYGAVTPEATAACRLALEEEGIALETTYTGKALAGLTRRAEAFRGRPVLFWNTYNTCDLGWIDELSSATPLPPRIAAWLEGGSERGVDIPG
jgi:D-cysteine desulfhydrase